MARWEIASRACLAAPACLTRMCSSARSPGPMHVAAAMFTPASEMATATSASAPGVFSTSMTRSTANPLPGGSLTEDDAARFDHSDDPFRPSVRALHADGGAVIVLFDGRGVTNEREDYENVFVWFLRMRDGLVVDETAVFDTVVSAVLWRGGPGG